MIHTLSMGSPALRAVLTFVVAYLVGCAILALITIVMAILSRITRACDHRPGRGRISRGSKHR